LHNNKKVALIYDFDGTLAPGNIQEPVLLRELGIEAGEFWKQARIVCQDNNADNILIYLWMILEECKKRGVPITRKALQSYGAQTKFFRGVSAWFGRMDAYCGSIGLTCRHYIISSANKELIEGSSIARHFTEIFACAYLFNEFGVAITPSVAVNYTGKTQYLYRINKGYYDVWDEKRINEHIEPEERDIPFEHMIYFGDGLTDIPIMKMLKERGGHSIAVYDPKNSEKLFSVQQLLWHDRVNAVFKADYSNQTALYEYITSLLQQIALPSAKIQQRIDDIERCCRTALPVGLLQEADKKAKDLRKLRL